MYYFALTIQYFAVALRQPAEVDLLAGRQGDWLAIHLNMYFVYAIYNQKHNKIYVGQTRNLQERLDLHNKKMFNNSYTSRYGGKWILIYSEKINTRTNALVREKQLKSFRGRQFIKKFIPR